MPDLELDDAVLERMYPAFCRKYADLLKETRRVSAHVSYGRAALSAIFPATFIFTLAMYLWGFDAVRALDLPLLSDLPLLVFLVMPSATGLLLAAVLFGYVVRTRETVAEYNLRWQQYVTENYQNYLTSAN